MPTIFNTRAEWEEFRKNGLGASDVAAILGISPWKSSLQLYHEKKGNVATGGGETFARRLGLMLEDPIAQLYSEKTNRKVERPPAGKFAIDVHPSRPYMMASLDGVQTPAPEGEDPTIGGTGVLEIKTAGIGKAEAWRNEAPIDYQVQVQHQLACTGLQWGSIAALVGGVSLFWSDVKRDEEFIEILEAACAEWWRKFELNEEPTADGSETTKEFLKRLYPIDTAKSVALPVEAIEWDAQRMAVKDEIKKLSARQLEAENKIKAFMGDATLGILPNGITYTWKTTNRRGYTVEPTSFRDFRRKGGPAEAPKAIARGTAPTIDAQLRRYYDEQEERAADAEFGDVGF
jgi:putative phage-type endonuclease